MKEAQYIDAIRMYRSFTGLNMTPVQFEEEPSEFAPPMLPYALAKSSYRTN